MYGLTQLLPYFIFFALPFSFLPFLSTSDLGVFCLTFPLELILANPSPFSLSFLPHPLLDPSLFRRLSAHIQAWLVAQDIHPSIHYHHSRHLFCLTYQTLLFFVFKRLDLRLCLSLLFPCRLRDHRIKSLYSLTRLVLLKSQASSCWLSSRQLFSSSVLLGIAFALNPPCLAVYQHACDCDLDLTSFSAPHRAGPSFLPHNDVILNIGLIKAFDSVPRRRLSDRNLSSYRDNSLHVHSICLYRPLHSHPSSLPPPRSSVLRDCLQYLQYIPTHQVHLRPHWN